MENDLFMSMLPMWQSQDTLPEMNSSSSSEQSPATCFFSPYWDKSPEEPLKFNSITSSPVSPPPSIKAPTNDGSLIRELIGKFENSPKLVNINMGLNSTTPNFSADPNSGFGSKSFMSRFGLNHGPELLNGITELTSLGKRVSRVSSSPSLKASEPSMAAQANNTLEELPSLPEGSSVSNPEKVNLKKRKPSFRGKVKEVEDEQNSKRAKQSENGSVKTEENRGGCSSDNAEEEKQNETKTAEPLKDYIHVRARRGQATDSHSLAERVRREKISERMKLLQDIVPGCNKVTGKALMLDEIINYVQSLQRQVEFLSMKLASVDSSSSSSNSMGFNAEASIMKDVLFRSEDTAHPMFPLDSSASTFYSQKNLPFNSSNQTILPLALDGLNQHLLSYDNFCGDDLHLQTIVNLGFGQTAFDPQSFRSE